MLRVYSELYKVESSVLFQARIGRISLECFLELIQVPNTVVEYVYDSSLETAEYILLYYPDTKGI